MTKKKCKCGRHFIAKRRGHAFCSRQCQLAARRTQPDAERSTIMVIPDTQCKPGVPNDHLLWIHDWALHRWAGQPLTVVHLGDHWDMPALSSYDRGKGKMEGRRVSADIAAGNLGMELLTTGRPGEVDGRWIDQPWDLHLLRGNHENRITRAIDSDVQLDGLLSLDLLESPGWQVHEFLDIVKLHGVNFSHYFYNPMTGRPYGGENLETRLKTIGASFVQGHQQGLKVANRNVLGKLHRGVVAGSCYQHDEDYLGPQGNDHWRGALVLHNVHDGQFSLMEVDLDYLCLRYTGHPLDQHRGVEL